MKEETFEQYLQKFHASFYQGTDDAMLENYNDWVEDLEKWELIELGNEYGKEIYNKLNLKK